jgi:hypothetical protein
MGDQRVVSLLKQFSKLQEERAMLYSKFQARSLIMLRTIQRALHRVSAHAMV